jgi:hypothetical protein
MSSARHIWSTAGALAITASGAAQCITYDFDDLAVGTIVSTQYDGVVFSAVPGSCGGGNPDPVIVVPASGTSSPTRALGIGTGCPDFSPDYLRMVFDDTQREVTFSLGEQVSSGVTFTIRAYNAAGVLISTQSAACGAGVFRLVRIAAGTAIIKRVEVESVIGLFETIDDLSFARDDTPPTARIDSPPWNSCECGTVIVSGLACDTDGEYGSDRLEYRLVGAAPDDPWTLIGTFTSPVCTPGTLYSWNTAAVPHGWYLLRLTVENACGLVSTAITAVIVDKQFGDVTITAPAAEATVCGEVVIQGSAQDACSACFSFYRVDYGPSLAGPWTPVDPAHPTYDSIVIDGNLASWDTEDLGVADGDWVIRVMGTDVCGNTATEYVSVTLDNGAGCLCADLNGNGTVDFGDLLIVLSEWGEICP